LKDFYVPLDNSHPQNSAQSSDCLQAMKARRMAQSAYSLDRAPIDFFLFWYLKQKLHVTYISDRETLKSAIFDIFSEIGTDMLISEFLELIKRLEWVDENKEE
jgi:hypothetical protein